MADKSLQQVASCSKAYCPSCCPSSKPMRLVVSIDATGRDSTLIDRLVGSHTPSTGSIEESYLHVLPRLKTNVARLHEQFRESPGTIAHYYPGCGTTPRRSGEWLPCTTGSDWMRIVAAAYRDILLDYRFGDSIILCGFSRGALGCRAIAQILDTIGLLPVCTVVDGRACEDLIAEALRAYDDLFHGRRCKKARKTISRISHTLRKARAGQPGLSPSGGILVEGLYCFDTVQSFWVRRCSTGAHADMTPFPRCLGFNGGVQTWERMFGSDPELVSPNVERAAHACCLGEVRIDYPLTPMRAHRGGKGVLRLIREVHFAGSHCDVGGGLVTRDLAAIALAWMAVQIVADAPGLLPSPSFDPQNQASNFWLDMCDGHLEPYGVREPHRYPVRLSDGFELVCSIAHRPRPRHLAKVIHGSVPDTVVRSYADGSSTAIAIEPLSEVEQQIRDRWQLEDDSARSHRTSVTNVRKLMRWATTTDLRIAATVGAAKQGFESAIGSIDAAVTSASTHVGAARTSAGRQYDMALHQLGRLSTLSPSAPTFHRRSSALL